MALYQFRFFSDSSFLYETRHDFDDDLDALDAAKLFSKTCQIEIWNAGRRVARVKLNDDPLDVQDVEPSDFQVVAKPTCRSWAMTNGRDFLGLGQGHAVFQP